MKKLSFHRKSLDDTQAIAQETFTYHGQSNKQVVKKSQRTLAFRFPCTNHTILRC